MGHIGDTKECWLCQNEFTMTSAYQKYCRGCATVMNRIDKRSAYTRRAKRQPTQAEWYAKNREKVLAKAKTKEASLIRHTRYRKNFRLLVLKYYSNGTMKCVRCGFSDERALQIDHIAGHGNEQKRAIRNSKENPSGTDFYHWLKRNNYPDGYQVLCANCNWIKRAENREYATAYYTKNIGTSGY